MAMSDELRAIQERVEQGLAKARTLEALEQVRVASLGKKGSLTAIMRSMGRLPKEERPAMGQLANTVRANVEAAIGQRREQLAKAALEARISAEAADVTLPGRRLSHGTEHLISQIREEIEDIFVGLGYTVEDGPFVETTYYNFTALNAPEDHPSRSAQDTFYVVDNASKGKESHALGESDVLLRTQTSGVQVHVMEEKRPPIYMICPGTVFRPDTADANHLPQFTQVEGLVVDEGITFGDLKGTLDHSVARSSARIAPLATVLTSSRSQSRAARSTSPAASAAGWVAVSARTRGGSRSLAAGWSTPTSSATWASTASDTPALPLASASSVWRRCATTCLTCACS